MKKNNVMRVFSLLLALTLISVCAISGTFAKYVTKAEGKDNARVAKWGVVVAVKGDSAFDTKYATDDEAAAATIEYSVVSSNGDKVVAPGTEFGKLSGSVKGTPEVATRYTLTIKDWTDIVLPAGTYTDYTEYVVQPGENEAAGYSKTVPTRNAYAPIKWDIVAKDGNGKVILSLLGAAADKLGTTTAALNAAGVRGFSATEAKAIIPQFKTQLEDLLEEKIPSGKNANIEIDGDNVSISIDFEPGKAMDYTFELVGKWAFEGPTASVTSTNVNAAIFDAETVDKLDTYLGNWQAVEMGQTIDGFEAPTSQDASLDISATLVATATQID